MTTDLPRAGKHSVEVLDGSRELREVESVCPGCRGSSLCEFGCKSGYLLRQCTKCGVVFTSVSDYDNAVDEMYEHYYDNARFSTPPVVVATLERLVRSCEPFRSSNRWLDIGYGEGGMLEVASRFGWLCYGTEISPAAIDFGERRGWTVAANAERDPRFIQHGFDVITMIELVEHLPTPLRLLEEAARWLRPGGLLYLTTPNANSLNRRVLGVDWSVLSPPEHVTIWSARGLRHALTSAGFKIQRVRTHGFNPCEIIARWRARGRDAQPVDRNTAAFALNTAFSSSPARRAFKAGINRCLSGVQAGDTLKIWAVRA